MDILRSPLCLSSFKSSFGHWMQCNFWWYDLEDCLKVSRSWGNPGNPGEAGQSMHQCAWDRIIGDNHLQKNENECHVYGKSQTQKLLSKVESELLEHWLWILVSLWSLFLSSASVKLQEEDAMSVFIFSCTKLFFLGWLYILWIHWSYCIFSMIGYIFNLEM